VKFYEEPKLNVLVLNVQDVITASGDTEGEDWGEWT